MEYDVNQIAQEIKSVRHKAERPLYIIFAVLQALAFVALFVFMLIMPALENMGGELSPELQAYLDQLTAKSQASAASSKLSGILDKIFEAMGPAIVFLALIALAVLLLYGFYLNYAKNIPGCVRVTEKNFPEIYAKSVEFAQKLGMKKVPVVYIGQQNGTLNAAAAWVFGKRYVLLNSEIVDIAYMDGKNFEGVYFVLAHEFGHQYFGHPTFWYNFFKFLIGLVPVLGMLLSRAQEYSADRVAQVITGQDGLRSLSVLTAGRHLYRHLDLDDYSDTLLNTDHKGFLERVSIFVVNLLASHPVVPYRFRALVDEKKRSGRLI